MLNAKDKVSTKLYNLLMTRDYDLTMLGANGRATNSPEEAEVFSFDYVAGSGKDYGTVVIMLGDDNQLEVFYADNIAKAMDGDDKQGWFDFLLQIRQFAVRNFMSFQQQNINRLKYSTKGQTTLKESWSGTKNISYNNAPNQARLMIQHNRPIGEGDARFRHISKLFVETSEGERYKLPFNNISGGRAMVEHVKHGGHPWDARGQQISNIVSEINVLGRFKRANNNKVFEGDANLIVSETAKYYESLRNTLKTIGSPRGYANYFETWNPMTITDQDYMVETVRELFATGEADERVEQALPILAKIQQGIPMKEIRIFESWARNLTEGVWALPDTKEKQNKLADILRDELIVGSDATNAESTLEHLFATDELFDELDNLASVDPDADARSLIMTFLYKYRDDPGVETVLTRIRSAEDGGDEEEENIDIDVDNGQEDVNIDQEEEVKESDYEYDETLATILKNAGAFPKEKDAVDYEVSDYDELDEGYRIIPPLDPGYEEREGLEGPINANGRPLYYDPKEGKYYDPRTDMYLDHDEAFNALREYGDEVDEGEIGAALGGLAGSALGGALGGFVGPVGAAVGGLAGKYAGKYAGDKIGDKISDKIGDMMPEARMAEPVHDPELARLKTLAGFMVK
jgi:hypothetical protein